MLAESVVVCKILSLGFSLTLNDNERLLELFFCILLKESMAEAI